MSVTHEKLMIEFWIDPQFSFSLMTDTKQKRSKAIADISNTTNVNVTTTEKPYTYDVPKHKRSVVNRSPDRLVFSLNFSQYLITFPENDNLLS